MKKPTISICIPFYSKSENAHALLNRCLTSVQSQSFRDYEIIVTENGRIAENTNSAIRKATGKIIKILFQDDYLTDSNSLQKIADSFAGGWLATGCLHSYEGKLINPHLPRYPEPTVFLMDGKEVPWDTMLDGNNTIGSPSVVAFENKRPILFDEHLDWLLDCNLYHQLYERYGEPTYLYEYNAVIGIHPAQLTNTLSDSEKLKEQQYIHEKYTTIKA